MEETSEAEKTRLKQKYREKKNAANKAVAKARVRKQHEWCDRIEEDGGKKMSSSWPEIETEIAKILLEHQQRREAMGHWSLE